MLEGAVPVAPDCGRVDCAPTRTGSGLGETCCVPFAVSTTAVFGVGKPMLFRISACTNGGMVQAKRAEMRAARRVIRIPL